ncbi:MAG: alpha-glucan family phosphorylase [Chloroflexota bacterium]|nr:alpha-glucan family phosphorylase [Chloroflexota bacterium]
MIKPVATVSVTPNLPEAINRLQELAFNLRWSWDRDSIELFRRLDRELWETSYHNPVRMLGGLSQERLEAAANDPAFIAHYQRVCSDFDTYMKAEDTWFSRQYGNLKKTPLIAYFSTEFGITESLQNYSGGLGVLSGDHLKSASDLGIPLVGAGLLYQEGYFRQYLNADGYQQETYPINDYSNLPVTLMRNADGSPLRISVPLPGRELYAWVYKVQVGRVPLYLLDSNIPDNTRDEDRSLTDRLYGGDRRTRIRQEILMGLGGIRFFKAIGLKPDIFHMNEGHSAFLALERIRDLMIEQKLTFQQAREIAAASNVFTTHTPVPAGLEQFGFDLMDEHFTDYYRSMGFNREQFLDLGREHIAGSEVFSLPVLALRLSAGANGVAQLHGVVSRKMWQFMYPSVPEQEVPIQAVTNGIHVQTWISNDMAQLIDRYIDPTWRTDESRADIWGKIDTIPDGELWRAHERRRAELILFARKRLVTQLKRRGVPQQEIRDAEEALNPDVLTIGFARRFATYKRATLLMRDVQRLKRILHNADCPVQIIFAGKAHPHDSGGKELIRQIAQLSRNAEFRHSVVFLEDYDMNVARYLIQGVDVWLNTPRRPKEASGTSGMKVIYNGGLNCSILDGWWDEAYDHNVGWAIGNGEEYTEDQADQQDYLESEALYNVLEQDIVPLFYERGREGLPREWIAKVKNSMRKLGPFFTTHRMVQQYTDQYYMPNFERMAKLTQPDMTKGLEYAAWRAQLDQYWGQVQVRNVQIASEEVQVGKQLEITASVALGALKPADVRVQVFYGGLNTRGEIENGEAVDMKPLNGNNDGTYTFGAQLAYQTSGERGISVRVLPHHESLPTPFQPGIIRWAN